MDWAELQADLGERYGSTWSFDATTLTIPAAANRAAVGVRHRQEHGLDWIEIASYVCAESSLRSSAALHESYEYPIGHLCVARGAVLLRQTLPLSSLTTEVLHQVIAAVGDRAPSLVDVVTRTADPSINPFDFIMD